MSEKELYKTAYFQKSNQNNLKHLCRVKCTSTCLLPPKMLSQTTFKFQPSPAKVLAGILLPFLSLFFSVIQLKWAITEAIACWPLPSKGITLRGIQWPKTSSCPKLQQLQHQEGSKHQIKAKLRNTYCSAPPWKECGITPSHLNSGKNWCKIHSNGSGGQFNR